MIFHYAGKYDGNEDTLPHREHAKGYTAFRELDEKKLSIIANAGSLITLLVLALILLIRVQGYGSFGDFIIQIIVGCILPLPFLVVHEFLHAICFRKNVYMYYYLNRGMLFVTGTEDMSKSQFIFLSLCPNLILGFIPYIIFLIFPNLLVFGLFGAVMTASGFGDYINVYNAMRQMPANAKTYLNGMHSYWYTV